MTLKRRPLRRISVGFAAAVSLLSLAQDASAQAWLKDRRFSEGPGYKTGDFELHPGLGAEIGYDSNWFLRTSKAGAANGNPVDAATLRVTPSLVLQSLSPQRREGQETPLPPPVSFRAAIAGTYREFFGGGGISDQRNLSLNSDVRVEIMPQRPWTFAIIGGYIRTIRPNTNANPDISFNTSNPYVGGELTWTPNNGTFDTTAAYTFNAILFEQSAGAPYTNFRHEIGYRNRWRFRPRTALFSDTTLGVITYNDANRAANVLTDSVPLRSRIGLNGLLTPRIAALGSVGYGGSFYSTGRATTQQFDSVIGQAEVRFYLTENPDASEPGKVSLTQSSLGLGYVRDFENSYLSDFNEVNKGYANLSYFFGGRVLTNITGSVAAVGYPNLYVNNAAGAPVQVLAGFTAVRPEVQGYGEYRFTDSLAVNLTLTFAANLTDANYTPPGNTLPFHLSWNRFQAFLGARWVM